MSVLTLLLSLWAIAFGDDQQKKFQTNRVLPMGLHFVGRLPHEVFGITLLLTMSLLCAHLNSHIR